MGQVDAENLQGGRKIKSPSASKLIITSDQRKIGAAESSLAVWSPSRSLLVKILYAKT